MLELRNKGWYGPLSELVTRSGNPLLIAVRDSYLDEVVKKWNLTRAVIIDISKMDYRNAGISIIEQIKSV